MLNIKIYLLADAILLVYKTKAKTIDGEGSIVTPSLPWPGHACLHIRG